MGCGTRSSAPTRSLLRPKVHLDGMPHTIIGVMPRGFYFPNRDVQIWRR